MRSALIGPKELGANMPERANELKISVLALVIWTLDGVACPKLAEHKRHSANVWAAGFAIGKTDRH